MDRKTYNKKYYEEHKEALKEKRRQAYASEPEDVKEKRRKRASEYYTKNRDTIRQKCNDRYMQDEDWREKRKLYARERQRYMQQLLDKAKAEESDV